MKNLDKLIEEIKISKSTVVGRTDKNTEAQYTFPWEGYNSRIVYEDKVYLSSLKKDTLMEIIQLKKALMNKVVFDGNAFAVQRALTKLEFDFVVVCANKHIGRQAIIL